MAPSKSKVPKLSETASQGCCKFCAEPEEKGKRFLICGHSLCMYKYYHIRCLSPEQIASEQQLGKRRWYCPSCLCRKCFRNVNDHEIILCDGCDEAYHLSCMEPPRTDVPKGDWYCRLCTEAKARRLEMKKLEQKMLKEHRKSDRAMVKSTKYLGFELLLSASDELEKREAAELRGNEEAAMAAQKPGGDEEAAAVAE
ncbi:hypothetical protein HU200_054940 [Digitaria exilis]|uniref:PHD-type domain-containing protein n=1 Tax=Digitaria exilis TaxID=1010633 RepID=A0A835E6G6_9POAL|nr:hypothetical protein HU200_054940 [Digitaria exilis]